MNAISTKKAPAAIGPYSQAIRVGNIVYTSGQIPLDPATSAFVEGGIKEQMHKARTGYRQEQDERLEALEQENALLRQRVKELEQALQERIRQSVNGTNL